MKIKDFILKPVISLYEGQILGNIEKIVVNKNFTKIKYFVINNSHYYLKTKDIFSIGNDAITIKNINKITLNSDFCLLTNEYILSPQNTKVYTYLGDFVGEILNIEFDDSFSITSTFINNGYKSLSIISSNENTLIIDDENNKLNKRIKIKSFPKKEEFSKDIKVNVEPIKTKTASLNFTIGRMVKKDIYGYSGELIIKKNTIITSKIINLAKENFKTQELIINSIPLVRN